VQAAAASAANSHSTTAAYKMFRRTDYHHADLQVRSLDKQAATVLRAMPA